MSYEYKVVPAPTRGLKAKGYRTAQDRFANALQTAMNAQAADGWEYIRTDTLPSEQREGFMKKTTVFQNMLVFRRAKDAPAAKVTDPVMSRPTKSGAERVAEKKKLAAPAPVSSPPPVQAPDVDLKEAIVPSETKAE